MTTLLVILVGFFLAININRLFLALRDSSDEKTLTVEIFLRLAVTIIYVAILTKVLSYDVW